MANALPPLPLRHPIEDADGLMSQPWIALMREIFNRIGGTSAQSNTDLHTTTLSLTDSIAQAEANFCQGRSL